MHFAGQLIASGRLLKLHREQPSKDVVGGPRGTITEWSSASRRRLLQALARVDFDSMTTPIEVTLTYPGDWRLWCSTGREAKRQLGVFLDRWHRRFGSRELIWKLEFQKRGAPHFQLVGSMPDGATINDVREFTHIAWGEVVGASCRIEASAVRNRAAMARYMAGYMTKQKGQETPPDRFSPGRWWFVPAALLLAQVVFQLDPTPTTRAKRIISRTVARRVHTKRRVRSQWMMTTGNASTLADRIALVTDG